MRVLTIPNDVIMLMLIRQQLINIYELFKCEVNNVDTVVSYYLFKGDFKYA